MESACVPAGYAWILYGAGLTSYVFNAVLLAVIFNCRKTELRKYGRILALNSMVDTTFMTIALLVQPHVRLYGRFAVVVLEGPLHQTSLVWNFYLPPLYFLFEYLTVFIVTLQFIYRYTVLCRQRVLSACQLGSLAMVILLISSAEALCMILSYKETSKNFADSEEFEGEVRCSANAIVPYLRYDKLSLANLLPVLLASVVMSSNYGVVMCCSLGIWQILAKSASSSRVLQKMHRELNYVMFLQALTPLVCVTVPVAITCVFLFAQVEANVSLEALSLVHLVPILNPLYALCFVKAYRRAVFDAMRGLWTHKRGVPTVLSGSSLRTPGTHHIINAARL